MPRANCRFLPDQATRQGRIAPSPEGKLLKLLRHSVVRLVSLVVCW